MKRVDRSLDERLQDGDGDIPPLPRIAIQAFAQSTPFVELVEALALDRRMARVQMRVQLGGISAAIEAFRHAPTPNLIIVEFNRDEVDTLPHALDDLAEHCDAGTRVVVVGPVNDVNLYRAAIKRGVSDYLVLPLEPLQFILALSELYRMKGVQRLGRSVAFIPARGGVGSSTLAHNASWICASRLSTPTILADLDLAFGTATLNFNQDPLRGLSELLTASEKPDENMVERTLCKVNDLLSLLSAGSVNDKMIDIGLSAFDELFDIVRGMAPLVVLDLPHQWTGWIQHVALACDDLVIVAEPDLASLRNVKKIIDYVTRLRSYDRKPFLIINRVNTPKRPEIPVQEFLKAFSFDAHWVVEFDAQTFGLAANNGQMLLEAGVPSALDKTLLDLSRSVAGRHIAPLQQAGGSLTQILTRFVARRR